LLAALVLAGSQTIFSRTERAASMYFLGVYHSF